MRGNTTIDAGCIVEITVLALDGHRLLIRGVLDRPLSFQNAVVMPIPDPPPDPPNPKALQP